MAVFYIGYNYKARKNGTLKIGESGQNTPSRRLISIRQSETFECMGAIKLIDGTKPTRLYVESHVRFMLERTYNELTSVGNDHFTYTINQGRGAKKKQIDEYVRFAMEEAVKLCEMYGIAYEIIDHTKYKRG